MGSRGPIPKKTLRSTKTPRGVRLRPLPDTAEAIFVRLAKDNERLAAEDAPLVELMAYWLEIAKEARRQMLKVDGDDAGRPDVMKQEIEALMLTVTDTTHGNKEESRKNPLLIVLRTATEQVRAIAQQLGSSPSARARLPEPETEQLSLAEILFADVERR